MKTKGEWMLETIYRLGVSNLDLPLISRPSKKENSVNIEDKIKRLEELNKLAFPEPWTADIDDPKTDPSWTGKFYYGIEENGNGGSWCPYIGSAPGPRNTQELNSLYLIEEMRNSLPDLLAEIKRLNWEIIELRSPENDPFET